ncbi:MAG: efflux RND transporter periplasmic adaptor subunit [Candidatus Azobacteroides sp.]|nr:efflux RND transporter periplasmic adaptor subunit [Candidatus Azobacteroides sp.]
MTKRIIRNIVLIGITAIIYSCHGGKDAGNVGEKSAVNQAFLENVKTVKVVLSNQEQELILTGKIEYDPDKVINYVPLISGIVVQTHFSLGDKVQKGQPLLDIRSTELSTLQSEKISLEAEEKVAERELKTTQSMFDDNLLSEKELLEAKGKLQQIQASIRKIKSDMSVYGTAKENGIFTVNAPMSGYVVYKKASQGSTISADSEAVFTIADLSTVWVTANVYASNLLFVREGMEVEMTTFSYPDELFHGKINSLSQVFDPEERVLKARIIMDNKNLKLKPEMSMLVKLKDKTSQQLASIPSDALIFDDNRYFVIVEKTAGNFVIREVVLQGHNSEMSYISSGLSEGENVVIANQLLIYQGLKEK